MAKIAERRLAAAVHRGLVVFLVGVPANSELRRALRLRILVPLALALSLGLPCVAQAQSTVTVNPTQGPPGTQVTITGAGWNPFYFPAPIQFWEEANGVVTYEADVGSATSSDPGCAPTANPDTGVACSFAVRVTVPSNAPAGVTGTLVDGAFPISERFVVAPADDDCCTAADFNVTKTPPTPTPKPKPKTISPKQLGTIGGVLLTLVNDWDDYCTLRPINACTPWKTRAVGKVLRWLEKLGKVISVINLGKVGEAEVAVGQDAADLSKDCRSRAGTKCPIKDYKSWPATARQALPRLYSDLTALRQSVIDMVDSFSPVPFAVPGFFDKYFPVTPCHVCSQSP